MTDIKDPTPVERYKQLRADAAFLRKYADPNASAGSTFWDHLRKGTAAAIANCTEEPPEGCYMAPLSKAQMFAIGYCANLAPLWLSAADRLDRDADQMVEELKKQAAEASSLAAELEKPQE